MAGNTANAGTWPFGDVLIAPITATNPVGNAVFGTDWKYVGLLDGSAGFGTDRSSDSDDHYAWGNILVEVTDTHYKETKTFTALEDNPVIFALTNPGSTVDFTTTPGTASGVIVVPEKEKFKIAFVTRKGGLEERHISKNYATLDGWPTKAKNEDDLSSQEVTVAIYPGVADAVTGKLPLWDYYRGPVKTTP